MLKLPGCRDRRRTTELAGCGNRRTFAGEAGSGKARDAGHRLARYLGGEDDDRLHSPNFISSTLTLLLCFVPTKK